MTISAENVIVEFIIYLYIRYYKPPKLSNLKECYASMSSSRLAIGRLFYFGYCLITWVGFFIIVYYFRH